MGPKSTLAHMIESKWNRIGYYKLKNDLKQLLFDNWDKSIASCKNKTSFILYLMYLWVWWSQCHMTKLVENLFQIMINLESLIYRINRILCNIDVSYFDAMKNVICIKMVLFLWKTLIEICNRLIVFHILHFL